MLCRNDSASDSDEDACPSELDDYTCRKLAALSFQHITVLNQAVLLKGVNDNAQTLINLSHRAKLGEASWWYSTGEDRTRGRGYGYR